MSLGLSWGEAAMSAYAQPVQVTVAPTAPAPSQPSQTITAQVFNY